MHTRTKWVLTGVLLGLFASVMATADSAGLKSRPPERQASALSQSLQERVNAGVVSTLPLEDRISVLQVEGGTSVPPVYEATRVSMGCAYAIAAYGNRKTLPGILEEALDEVDRLDRLMSHYKRTSALSRLNRQGARAPVTVDPELFAFIETALRYSRESDGAFDITVGPLMKTWGFFEGEGRLPNAHELAAVRRRVGYRHVRTNAASHSIWFDTEGVELDLGGIGKGYAVDRVVAFLRQRGVTAALVSAGGSTVYGLGAPPGRDGWDVSLDDPLSRGRRALTLRLRDRALSIAGSAEKYFDVGSTRYTHIMDPRTGTPVEGVLTVAVLTSTGADGDAWDDALFVQGVRKGRRYVRRMRNTEAYFLLPDGSGWRMVHVSGR